MKFEINKAIIIKGNTILDIDWDYINLFNEFSILNTTEQNPKWHSEGNVMKHTQLVCKEMIDYINNVGLYITDANESKILLMSALFHDIGKGLTTKIGDDGNWTSPNHAIVGEKITRRILWNELFETREHICNLVRFHMQPLYIDNLFDESNVKKIISLSQNRFLTLQELYILKYCDCVGAIKESDDIDDIARLDNFRELSLKYKCYNSPYKFTGEFEAFNYFHSDDVYPSMYNYNNTEFKVYIMVGLPGSGKDTYIKENFPNIPTVCRDDIRKEIGLKGDKPQGNKKEETLVTNIVNNKIKEYCRTKIDFIINATSLKKFYRDGLIGQVLPYNPYIEIIYIEAPTIEDNLKRRKGQIPENIILNMQDNFDFPRETECHKLTIAKQYGN